MDKGEGVIQKYKCYENLLHSCYANLFLLLSQYMLSTKEYFLKDWMIKIYFRLPAKMEA